MRGIRCGGLVALALGCGLGCAAPGPAAEQGAADSPGGAAGSPDGKADLLVDPARAPLPIVLLHGMAGFDRIGPLDYYYRVADTLENDGHEVFTTVVDPLQLIEVRAEQLADQIDVILADTGAPRVHLIAHSQGGLDARFLVSSLGYGDRIATLTSISTPHRGSRIADVALGLLPGPTEDAAGFVIDLLVGGAVGSDQDVVGQVYQLTEDYAVHTFGPENPDDPDVAYYSVGGVTQLSPFVNPFDNDLCDPLLLAGYALLAPHGESDAVVSVDSARHGTFLGTVPADHFDEVGQIFGSTALGFDHRRFYRDLARFLTDPSADAPL